MESPRSPGGARSRTAQRGSRRRLALMLYSVYLAFLLLTTAPILAELGLEENMQETYDYDMVFMDDEGHTHYEVDRWDAEEPGTIDLTYDTASHTLEVDVINIRNLTIDCLSVFNDEGGDVFGEAAQQSDSLYIEYFIDRGTFNVKVDTSSPIDMLTFDGAPDPVSVRSNSDGSWLIWGRGDNYTVTGEGAVKLITLLSVPDGHDRIGRYLEQLAYPDDAQPFGEQ